MRPGNQPSKNSSLPFLHRFTPAPILEALARWRWLVSDDVNILDYCLRLDKLTGLRLCCQPNVIIGLFIACTVHILVLDKYLLCENYRLVKIWKIYVDPNPKSSKMGMTILQIRNPRIFFKIYLKRWKFGFTLT